MKASKTLNIPWEAGELLELENGNFAYVSSVCSYGSHPVTVILHFTDSHMKPLTFSQAVEQAYKYIDSTGE